MVMLALAQLGAGIERFALEIRHLQRTEVDEVEEGFTKGQKGSSAMPHKKNPIGAENLCGLARILKANGIAALDNVALWHERDISHSSVERVIFPDSFLLADYMLWRAAEIFEKLVVKEKNMKKNLSITRGRVFSSHVLLALIEKGLSREEAYKIVQAASHQGEGELQKELLKIAEVQKLLGKKAVQDIFSGKRHFKMVTKILKRVMQ
jgi:adenylosuccinate lyase